MSPARWQGRFPPSLFCLEDRKERRRDEHTEKEFPLGRLSLPWRIFEMTMLEFVKDLNLAVIVMFAVLYLYQVFYAVVGLVCRRWQEHHQPSRLHRFGAIVSARN